MTHRITPFPPPNCHILSIGPKRANGQTVVAIAGGESAGIEVWDPADGSVTTLNSTFPSSDSVTYLHSGLCYKCIMAVIYELSAWTNVRNYGTKNYL